MSIINEPEWHDDEPNWQDDEPGDPTWQDDEPNQDDDDDDNMICLKRLKESASFVPIKDWSKVSRDDFPDVVIITEEIDIDNLRAFAASPEALYKLRDLKKIMLNAKGDCDWDEKDSKDDYTGKSIVMSYLRNINYQNKFDVRFRHDVKGQMFIDEGILTALRLFAYSHTDRYPFSVTQLPKIIKGIALDRHFQENDDSAAFHRIVLSATQNTRAIKMSKEIIKNKDKVYQSILEGGKFKQWVGPAEIKEIVHALSNGQSIKTVITKYGDSSPWLDSWSQCQREARSVICNSEKGRKAIQILKMFFPTKTIHSNIELKNGVRVRLAKPKTIQIQADAYKTYRFFKTSETETLALLENSNSLKKTALYTGRQYTAICLANESKTPMSGKCLLTN